MDITEDAKQRVSWINKRVELSERQQDCVEFQIKEAIINSQKQVHNFVLDLVSKSFTHEQLVDMYESAWRESFEVWKSKRY